MPARTRIRKPAANNLLTIGIYTVVLKGNLMMKKFALLLALFASFSNLSFAAGSHAAQTSSLDGSDDVIEAMGGTRNGGDC